MLITVYGISPALMDIEIEHKKWLHLRPNCYDYHHKKIFKCVHHTHSKGQRIFDTSVITFYLFWMKCDHNDIILVKKTERPFDQLLKFFGQN